MSRKNILMEHMWNKKAKHWFHNHRGMMEQPGELVYSPWEGERGWDEEAQWSALFDGKSSRLPECICQTEGKPSHREALLGRHVCWCTHLSCLISASCLQRADTLMRCNEMIPLMYEVQTGCSRRTTSCYLQYCENPTETVYSDRSLLGKCHSKLSFWRSCHTSADKQGAKLRLWNRWFVFYSRLLAPRPWMPCIPRTYRKGAWLWYFQTAVGKSPISTHWEVKPFSAWSSVCNNNPFKINREKMGHGSSQHTPTIMSRKQGQQQENWNVSELINKRWGEL